MITSDEWAAFCRFREVHTSKFRKCLGPSAKRGFVSKKDMEPTRSSSYPLALRILHISYGEEGYSSSEFESLLRQLGYPFFDESGGKKGSGRDYMKVLSSFCDGNMKGSATQADCLDVSSLNAVSTSLQATHPLRRGVVAFQRRTGDKGHGRMEEALAFVMWAQLQRCNSITLDALRKREGGAD